MARQTLDSWINEALSDMSQDGPCWMISCSHMRGNTPEEVYHTKFGNRDWTAKELGNIYQRKAESYAQDLSGPQTFCMFAFYNKSNEPTAKHPFIIRGSEEFGGLGTESADTKGMIQQGMRHTEIALGMALRHQKEVNDQMLTMFKLVGEQNATLLRENIDAMSVVKDIMMQQAVSDSQGRMAQAEFERKTGERAKLLQLAPALANQVFGREIFPQSTADTAIIESITNSMDENQLVQLMSILKPEQAALLAPRMQLAIENKQRQDEAARPVSDEITGQS